MKISAKGRYARQIMVDPAVHDTGEYTVLQDIAHRQGSLENLCENCAGLTGGGFSI